MAEQTKKRLMTMKLETKAEGRSKNTPAIIDYRHRCHKRQPNENLPAYNFKIQRLSYTWHEAVHSAAQLSLLVSVRRSCHIHAQCPRWQLCPSVHPCVGLKMRCGQAHCWCIAILRQQKAIAPLTNKNLVQSRWCSTFLLCKGCIIQIVRCAYISRFTTGVSDADICIYMCLWIVCKHSDITDGLQVGEITHHFI